MTTDEILKRDFLGHISLFFLRNPNYSLFSIWAFPAGICILEEKKKRLFPCAHYLLGPALWQVFPWVMTSAWARPAPYQQPDGSRGARMHQLVQGWAAQLWAVTEPLEGCSSVWFLGCGILSPSPKLIHFILSVQNFHIFLSPFRITLVFWGSKSR